MFISVGLTIVKNWKCTNSSAVQ